MKWLKSIYYSFPVQLLMLHLQRHHLLLIFWVLPLASIVNYLGRKLGIPFLFLDPEYLGQVDFWSFFFVGAAFGGFFVTWNITTYILNSYRFPFLATLRKPFTKYSLNNFALPLIFLVVYVVTIIIFQYQNKFQHFGQVLILLGGFFTGMTLVIVMSFTYFLQTNRDIFGVLKIRGLDREEMSRQFDSKPLREEVEASDIRWRQRWRVDTYLAHPFKARLVRSTAHYDNKLLEAVFRQNHSNALVIEAGALILLISLGFLINYPAFRIPAGASVFILMAVFTMITGALGFLLKGWSTLFFILLLLGVNFLMKFDLLGYQNKAYGLNYQKPPLPYTYDTLRAFSSNRNVQHDKDSIYPILNNWKQQFADDPKYKHSKPKMIFINVSGGGLRSAVWAFKCLQQADSLVGGDLFKHTFLITGASGGMIGAAYYRELYRRKQKGADIDLSDPKYLDRISKDLLNAITFSIAVNDLFYPFHYFKYKGHQYQIDRGYAFERQLNENTNFILDKPISAYRQPEKKMLIPMMIFNPVIITDARSLYISPQPVTYLTKHISIASQDLPGMEYLPEIDGVDFRKLFGSYGADSLRFTSALRMNATFPYISPNVTMPTKPAIQVMDAGMRDNFGTETAVRFVHNFRNWIDRNTGGVVFFQIRDIPKVFPIEDVPKGVIDKLFDPIGNFYLNWQEYQDFHHEHLFEHVKSCFPGQMDALVMQYLSEDMKKRAALSWHLTASEQQNVLGAIDFDINKATLKKLDQLLQ